MNPAQSLLRSRKFWLLVLDVLVSSSLYFVGKYASPQLDDIEFLIGAIQPVFVMIISAIAWEDAAAKRAGNVPSRL